jgi:hypothetical protein
MRAEPTPAPFTEKQQVLEDYLERILSETLSRPGAYVRVSDRVLTGEDGTTRRQMIRDIVEEIRQPSSDGEPVLRALNACDTAFVNGLAGITIGALLGGPAGAAGGFILAMVDLMASC